MKIYDITPMGKPRMTQRDKWQKRDVVLRYRAFKDECNLKKVSVPDANHHVIFSLPMPKSWSKKKRQELNGQPHQQKPDIDNLLKALMDAVLKEDSGVSDIRATKVWGEAGQIIIKPIELVEKSI